MKKILEYQGYLLTVYIIVGCGLYLLTRDIHGLDNRLLGLSVTGWLLISWIFAGLQHGWILLFWRMELYKKAISGFLGKRGFPVHRTGFYIIGTFCLVLKKVVTFLPR
ncbi:MAG: hypothetical protein OEZ36_08470 [Spirochaetota bacterium]|nr:hypothetical protein [Spirochaetota bacterium]